MSPRAPETGAGSVQRMGTAVGRMRPRRVAQSRSQWVNRCTRVRWADCESPLVS